MDSVLLRKIAAWAVGIPVFLIAFFATRVSLNLLALNGVITDRATITSFFLVEVLVGVVVACLAVMPIWPKPTPTQVSESKEN